MAANKDAGTGRYDCSTGRPAVQMGETVLSSVVYRRDAARGRARPPQLSLCSWFCPADEPAAPAPWPSLPRTPPAVAKHRRSIAGQQSALEDLWTKRADVLETASMEQVALPVLVDGSQQAEDDDAEEEEEEEGAGGRTCSGGSRTAGTLSSAWLRFRAAPRCASRRRSTNDSVHLALTLPCLPLPCLAFLRRALQRAWMWMARRRRDPPAPRRSRRVSQPPAAHPSCCCASLLRQPLPASRQRHACKPPFPATAPSAIRHHTTTHAACPRSSTHQHTQLSSPHSAPRLLLPGCHGPPARPQEPGGLGAGAAGQHRGDEGGAGTPGAKPQGGLCVYGEACRSAAFQWGCSGAVQSRAGRGGR